MAKPFSTLILFGCSLLGLLAVPSLAGIPPVGVGGGNGTLLNTPSQASYTPSDPIMINGDDALRAFNPKNGSGTKDNPYVIQNLEIINSSSLVYYGIYIFNIHECYLRISHCRIVLNSVVAVQDNIGIVVGSSGNVTVEDCVLTGFHNCDPSSQMHGIFLDHATNCTVQNNVVTDFIHVYTVLGIRVESSQNCTLKNNTISEIQAAAGISCVYFNVCGNITAEQNRITGMITANRGNTINLFAVGPNGDYFIIDNEFYDIQSEAHLIGLYYWGGVNRGKCVNNTFEDISTVGMFGGVVIYAGSNIQVTSNILRRVTADVGSYGIDLDTGASNNIISGNIIATGNVPTRDLGTKNTWAGYLYFAPRGDYYFVGNYYWNYTGIDANGDLIGDTPELFFNANDTAPIMFGALDNDQDGLLNYLETGTYGTNLNAADSDSDGLLDGAEVNTYHTDPLASDSDGDGLADGTEVATYHTNPLAPDSDTDGLSDGAEVNAYHTQPLASDTDSDGILDGVEAVTYHTNASASDTDGDGWSDDYEIFVVGTDPCSSDTDGDGLADAVDPNPLQATVIPPIDYSNSIIIAAAIMGGAVVFLGVVRILSQRKVEREKVSRQLGDKLPDRERA